MTTTRFETEADHLRRQLEEEKDTDQAVWWAVTAACGTIRDRLHSLTNQIDAIYEVLDARGVWDDEEETR